jgi:hypothetical protein
MTTLRLAALLTAALLALPAQAAPLVWTFDNAVFEDGGIATGSFVFDADTGSFSAVNVTTTAGTLASGATYTDRVFGDATTAGLVTGSGDLTGTPLLGLAFLPPLTNAGGFVALIDIFFPPASSFEAVCDDAACMTATFSRQFVDGALVASPVPLPAAAWLFGAALGALPLLRRRG